MTTPTPSAVTGLPTPTVITTATATVTVTSSPTTYPPPDTSNAIVVGAVLAAAVAVGSLVVTWKVGSKTAAAARISAEAAQVAGAAATENAVAAKQSASAATTSADAATKSASAAEKSADAATVNATASDRSSKAAVDAVGVNRETATSVALRAHADALAKRYQDAATQIGHDKPPVRLAGVYAMARLADDWEQERQTCINVLCAYLRMPWTLDESKQMDEGDGQVRLAAISVIREHLLASTKISWRDHYFDFSTAQFWNSDFKNAVFETEPDFSRTIFLGKNNFSDVKFVAGADFRQMTVGGNGSVDFGETVLGQVKVDMSGATVRPLATLRLAPRSIDSLGGIDLLQVKVEGGLWVYLRQGFAEQGPIDLSNLKVLPGGYLDINAAPGMPAKPYKTQLPLFSHVRLHELQIDIKGTAEIAWDYIGLGIIDQWLTPASSPANFSVDLRPPKTIE